MAKGGLGKALLAGVGLIAGAFVVRGAIQRAGRARAYLAEGIDEKTWINLGGIEQWVTIRGRDPDNPLLLMLHGGPGSAMGPFAHKAYPHWDEHFTVVNWDQRGAGRTFGRNGKSGSGELTIGRMVVDGIELVEELRRRLPGRPVILMGWSWGSLLGAEMIRARPDLFAAYVGVGQAVDMARGESLSYFGAIDRLRAKGDERKAEALEAVGPPPYPNLKGLMKQRRMLISTMPKAERRIFQRMFVDLLLAPDSTLKDLPDYVGGLRFSMRELWPKVSNWRLADGGLSFEVPVVFIQGDLDLQTPTALVTEVVPKLQAPAKELVIIEDAGHVALMTHPDRFRRELVERVLPFALAKPKGPRRRRQGA
jgi:pimeloyl-ACP methyl ester carboxylesterase